MNYYTKCRSTGSYFEQYESPNIVIVPTERTQTNIGSGMNHIRELTGAGEQIQRNTKPVDFHGTQETNLMLNHEDDNNFYFEQYYDDESWFSPLNQFGILPININQEKTSNSKYYNNLIDLTGCSSKTDDMTSINMDNLNLTNTVPQIDKNTTDDKNRNSVSDTTISCNKDNKSLNEIVKSIDENLKRMHDDNINENIYSRNLEDNNHCIIKRNVEKTRKRKTEEIMMKTYNEKKKARHQCIYEKLERNERTRFFEPKHQHGSIEINFDPSSETRIGKLGPEVLKRYLSYQRFLHKNQTTRQRRERVISNKDNISPHKRIRHFEDKKKVENVGNSNRKEKTKSDDKLINIEHSIENDLRTTKKPYKCLEGNKEKENLNNKLINYKADIENIKITIIQEQPLHKNKKEEPKEKLSSSHMLKKRADDSNHTILHLTKKETKSKRKELSLDLKEKKDNIKEKRSAILKSKKKKEFNDKFARFLESKRKKEETTKNDKVTKKNPTLELQKHRSSNQHVKKDKVKSYERICSSRKEEKDKKQTSRKEHTKKSKTTNNSNGEKEINKSRSNIVKSNEMKTKKKTTSPIRTVGRGNNKCDLNLLNKSSDKLDCRTILIHKRNKNQISQVKKSKFFKASTPERDNLIVTVKQDVNANFKRTNVTHMSDSSKTKKAKTVKLVINIECHSTESDDSDQTETRCTSPHDVSFLDDLNIDEIVNSLNIGNTGSKGFIDEINSPDNGFIRNGNQHNVLHRDLTFKKEVEKHILPSKENEPKIRPSLMTKLSKHYNQIVCFGDKEARSKDTQIEHDINNAEANATLTNHSDEDVYEVIDLTNDDIIDPTITETKVEELMEEIFGSPIKEKYNHNYKEASEKGNITIEDEVESKENVQTLKKLNKDNQEAQKVPTVKNEKLIGRLYKSKPLAKVDIKLMNLKVDSDDEHFNLTQDLNKQNPVITNPNALSDKRSRNILNKIENDVMEVITTDNLNSTKFEDYTIFQDVKESTNINTSKIYKIEPYSNDSDSKIIKFEGVSGTEIKPQADFGASKQSNSILVTTAQTCIKIKSKHIESMANEFQNFGTSESDTNYVKSSTVTTFISNNKGSDSSNLTEELNKQNNITITSEAISDLGITDAIQAEEKINIKMATNNDLYSDGNVKKDMDSNIKTKSTSTKVTSSTNRLNELKTNVTNNIKNNARIETVPTTVQFLSNSDEKDVPREENSNKTKQKVQTEEEKDNKKVNHNNLYTSGKRDVDNNIKTKNSIEDCNSKVKDVTSKVDAKSNVFNENTTSTSLSVTNLANRLNDLDTTVNNETKNNARIETAFMTVEFLCKSHDKDIPNVGTDKNNDKNDVTFNKNMPDVLELSTTKDSDKKIQDLQVEEKNDDKKANNNYLYSNGKRDVDDNIKTKNSMEACNSKVRDVTGTVDTKSDVKDENTTNTNLHVTNSANRLNDLKTSINDKTKNNTRITATSTTVELSKSDEKDIPYVEIVKKNPKKQIINTKNNTDILELGKMKHTYLKFIEVGVYDNLNKNITITELIHNGRYSEIYKYKDVKGGIFAIKISKRIFTERTETYNNGSMLLLHKNCSQYILEMHNTLNLSGRYCFLSDYYPKNLEEALIENQRCFHINLVQKLAKQLVSAVAALATNRLIHADIKPKHILLNSANNRLKLCGFDKCNYSDKIVILPKTGTPIYRAPETILGFCPSYGVDVWATALVIFEMATKSPLFPGRYNNDILYYQLCTLDNFDLDMLEKCTFGYQHFFGKKFKRRIGNTRILVPHFQRNNILQRTLFNSYNKHWRQRRYDIYEDICKIKKLQEILEKMLIMDPRRRLPILYIGASDFFCDVPDIF